MRGGMGRGGRGGEEVDLFEHKKEMSLLQLLTVLKPYFWPEAGSEGAVVNRVRAISTWVCVSLSKIFSLISPFCLSLAADALLRGDWTSASRAISLYCALRVASSLAKEMQGLLYVKVRQIAGVQLQELTFRHLHSLSLQWHVNRRSGSVMKAMDRGVDAVATLVNFGFLYLFPALLECAAVIFLFFFKFSQWGLGLAVLIGVVLYIATTIFITEWRKKFREAANKSDNDFHDKANDSLLNFETVKYFTAEEREVSRFRKSVESFQAASASTSSSTSALNMAQQVILWGSMMAAMLVSGRAVLNGDMTVGDFVGVQAWVGGIFAPLGFLGSVYSAVVQSLIDIKNLSQLLAEEPDVVDKPGASHIPFVGKHWKGQSNIYSKSPFGWSNNSSNNNQKNNNNIVDVGEVDLEKGSGMEMSNINLKSPLLSLSGDNEKGLYSRLSNNEDEDNSRHSFPANIVNVDGQEGGVSVSFDGVWFHYPSQTQDKGLRDVSFVVKAGSTTAVVGSTGAGKSTLGRLLFRFYDPSMGRVLLGGLDIKDYTQQSVRACIGVVPQDSVLFNDSILYNIQYGRLDATFQEVREAASAAQLLTFIESLPKGWDTQVGERGLKLSGGEKQRVAIARCLLKNPPIVLLDEATSALDTVTEHSVQEALNALGKQRTVIVIAHRLSTIKHADQIIVLDQGQVVEKGSHEYLLSLDKHYARLWNMQIRGTAMTHFDERSDEEAGIESLLSIKNV